MITGPGRIFVVKIRKNSVLIAGFSQKKSGFILTIRPRLFFHQRGLLPSFGTVIIVRDGDDCGAFGDVSGIVNGLEGYGVNPGVCVGVAEGS